MTIEYNTNLRNDRMNEVSSSIDAVGIGKIRMYSGTRPSFGGASGVLLVELEMSAVSFAPAVIGVITANPITPITAISNGSATWFRIVNGAGNPVLEGSVGANGSGADLELSTVVFSIGLYVVISTLSITEGN